MFVSIICLLKFSSVVELLSICINDLDPRVRSRPEQDLKNLAELNFKTVPK